MKMNSNRINWLSSVIALTVTLLTFLTSTGYAQKFNSTTPSQRPAASAQSVKPAGAAAQSPAAQSQTSAKKYTFKSARAAGSMDKVTYQQDIQGQLMVPSSENSDKNAQGPGAPEKVTIKTPNGGAVEMDAYPVKAVTKLSYNEKNIESSADGNSFTIQAIRNYKEVNVQRTVNGAESNLALPAGKMTLNVEFDDANCTFFHKQYCMTQDELDVLEVMAPSTIMECLLPTTPVAIGDTWTISEEALTSMLQLDLLNQAQVEQVLTDVKGSTAIIDAQGIAQGEVDGVKATISFKLKYYYSFKSNRIIWAGMVTNEERRSGPITPDLKIETRVSMTITPITTADDATLAAEKWVDPTDELLLIYFTSEDGTWTLFHNRFWCIFKNEPNQVIFRFMYHGQYIAQCVINKTNNPESVKNMTLEGFKQQVWDAINDEKVKTRSIVATNEEVSPANVNVFQVIAEDTSDNSQWSYYMLKGSKPSEQLVFMFMLDKTNAEIIEDSDMEMVGTLEFKTPAAANK